MLQFYQQFDLKLQVLVRRTSQRQRWLEMSCDAVPWESKSVMQMSVPAIRRIQRRRAIGAAAVSARLRSKKLSLSIPLRLEAWCDLSSYFFTSEHVLMVLSIVSR